MARMQAHQVRGMSQAAARKTHRTEDNLGAVVPLPAWEIPKDSREADLSNVIPFLAYLRNHPHGNSRAAPSFVCDHEMRPCPFLMNFDFRKLRKQWSLLFIGSVATHASFVVWFLQSPPPLASIGMEAIAVEMVLGSHLDAGTAKTHGKALYESAASPDLGKPNADRTEFAEQKQVAKNDFTPQMQMTPLPIPQPEPELSVDPDKKPVLQATKKETVEAETKPLKDTGQAKRQKIAAASQASVAASSIGVGRSDLDSNYRGRVIAHLSRHKKFPEDAKRQGETGIGTVTLTINGSGTVTSANLARSSGSTSLDREAVAMVYRASPFPAPPSGQPASFTAPINFNLR